MKCKWMSMSLALKLWQQSLTNLVTMFIQMILNYLDFENIYQIYAACLNMYF